MLTFNSFGELRSAISNETIEGMSTGYYFLDIIFNEYLDNDADSSSPQLPFNHELNWETEEEFLEMLNATPVPDDFWDYVEYRAERLLEPIDCSIPTPGTPEGFWEAIQAQNQEGGRDILHFLEQRKKVAGTA